MKTENPVVLLRKEGFRAFGDLTSKQIQREASSVTATRTKGGLSDWTTFDIDDRYRIGEIGFWCNRREIERVCVLISKAAAYLSRKYGGIPFTEAFNAEIKALEKEIESTDESRKKETDEVDGSTQTGDETHGGDSSSGEVPDGESLCGHDSSDTSETGILESSDSNEDSKEDKEDNSFLLLKKALKKKMPQGHGNTHFDTLSPTDKVVAKKVQSLFSRLVMDGGEGEMGPRWDYAEMAARLKTYRPLSPARREEAGRPVILVLPDVSGSCSSFSEPSLEVAQAVGSLGVNGADVLVIPHANGEKPWKGASYSFNGVLHPIKDEQGNGNDKESLEEFASRLLNGQPLTVVIILGDSDGLDTFVRLAQRSDVQRVIWLDNYCCTQGSPISLTPSFADAFGSSIRKVSYVIRCGNTDDMLQGIRVALR